MKAIVLFIALITSSLSFAQTKAIAHKSHSGSRSSFTKAYKKSLFKMNRSSFGLPSRSPILLLDSVIAINDSMTIFSYRVTKMCFDFSVVYDSLDSSVFTRERMIIKNHSVIYKKNSLEVIKALEQYKYPLSFLNPLSVVIFQGFEE